MIEAYDAQQLPCARLLSPNESELKGRVQVFRAIVLDRVKAMSPGLNGVVSRDGVDHQTLFIKLAAETYTLATPVGHCS